MSEADSPKLNYDLLMAYEGKGRQDWSVKDTIIYNLGVGFGISAIDDPEQLRFVLEDKIASFPTMGAVVAISAGMYADPRYGIAYNKILHGEEAIELLRPMPASATFTSTNKVDGIWDRGAEGGAIMQVSRTVFADDEAVAVNRSVYMLRGNGGFGGSMEGAPKAAAAPDRDPDGYYDLATRDEQALIYRLSGDTNPLHSVPKVAAKAGFPKPILMGLCNWAIAARGLVAGLADGDQTRLKRVGARFASVVYPGETIRTEYWKLGDGEIAFRCRVVERDQIVLTGGKATIA
ncbi:MaoC/PaaZ C-terminal domain-containing protein [Sphingomonas crocodyli]|nr:MaoC/PaaZ C-terminal domain-containing protein [Sphingomonas crocodyli]